MTAYQVELLETARQFWEQKKQLPIQLYAALASTGMDVPKVEAVEQYYAQQHSLGEK